MSMDHYKEASYLLALDLIKHEDADYACNALSRAAMHITGEPLEAYEIASRFIDLFDGSFWGENPLRHHVTEEIHGWWSIGHPARPRALALAAAREY